jgi:hypothetical protein
MVMIEKDGWTRKMKKITSNIYCSTLICTCIFNLGLVVVVVHV